MGVPRWQWVTIQGGQVREDSVAFAQILEGDQRRREDRCLNEEEPWQRHSLCKGPAAGLCLALVCWGNNQKGPVAGAE